MSCTEIKEGEVSPGQLDGARRAESSSNSAENPLFASLTAQDFVNDPDIPLFMSMMSQILNADPSNSNFDYLQFVQLVTVYSDLASTLSQRYGGVEGIKAIRDIILADPSSIDLTGRTAPLYPSIPGTPLDPHGPSYGGSSISCCELNNGEVDWSCCGFWGTIIAGLASVPCGAFLPDPNVPVGPVPQVEYIAEAIKNYQGCVQDKICEIC